MTHSKQRTQSEYTIELKIHKSSTNIQCVHGGINIKGILMDEQNRQLVNADINSHEHIYMVG